MRVRKNILIMSLLGLIIYSLRIGKLAFCEEEAFNRIELNEKNFRDPFVSLLPSKEIIYQAKPAKTEPGQPTLPDFSVQGLIWGTGKPQAIINNKVYNIGEQVEGAKIIEISRDGVKVSYQDKIFLVAPENVNTTSKKIRGR